MIPNTQWFDLQEDDSQISPKNWKNFLMGQWAHLVDFSCAQSVITCAMGAGAPTIWRSESLMHISANITIQWSKDLKTGMWLSLHEALGKFRTVSELYDIRTFLEGWLSQGHLIHCKMKLSQDESSLIFHQIRNASRTRKYTDPQKNHILNGPN